MFPPRRSPTGTGCSRISEAPRGWAAHGLMLPDSTGLVSRGLADLKKGH